ncbi:tRNA lysidine(34) synthetase TilS [Candidatus Saccharibacteria bacterium]|nr:tRNA lysidine(34) synthetase TilS [Candidatus Saccharibacteria bacterium]
MKIILAVSGGVDSVCMLHAWKNNPSFLDITENINYAKTEVIVAHFDHGIRDDSSADALFVQALAEKYDYSFVSGRGDLMHDTSEATARKARFVFLRSLLENHDDRIATAHHFDDKRETQIINLIRGTNRKGLSVLQNKNQIIRPLINKTKLEIYEYASKNNLEWVEDSTNQSDDYLRNRLRRNVMPTITDDKKLWTTIDNVDRINTQVDPLLEELAKNVLVNKNTIKRELYRRLPVLIRLNILQLIYTELLNETSEKQRLSKARLVQLDDWICDSSKNHKRDIAGKIVVDLADNSVTLKAK